MSRKWWTFKCVKPFITQQLFEQHLENGKCRLKNSDLKTGNASTSSHRILVCCLTILNPSVFWVMMTSSNGNIYRVTGHLYGEFTGPGEFPTQRPVTLSFNVIFDLRLNQRLSKQPWSWWFETLPRPLWRHCNGNIRLSLQCAMLSLYRGWSMIIWTSVYSGTYPSIKRRSDYILFILIWDETSWHSLTSL